MQQQTRMPTTLSTLSKETAPGRKFDVASAVGTPATSATPTPLKARTGTLPVHLIHSFSNADRLPPTQDATAIVEIAENSTDDATPAPAIAANGGEITIVASVTLPFTNEGVNTDTGAGLGDADELTALHESAALC
jgi:hypothetical protein